MRGRARGAARAPAACPPCRWAARTGRSRRGSGRCATNASRCTTSGAPIDRRLATSQSCTVPSALDVASVRPSGVKRALRIRWPWPRMPGPAGFQSSVEKNVPVPLYRPTNSSLPSGENATERASSSSGGLPTSRPEATSRTSTPRSPPAPASSRPSGLNVQLVGREVALERGLPAAADVPDQQPAVVAADVSCGDEAPVGRERDRLDPAAQAFEAPDRCQRARVPEPELALVARDRQQAPVRAEVGRERRLVERLEDGARLERGGVEQLDRAVARASRPASGRRGSPRRRAAWTRRPRTGSPAARRARAGASRRDPRTRPSRHRSRR